MRAIFPLGCKVLVLLGMVLGAFTFPAIAQTTQTFGNEWINYSQQYYKIKIARTGIYRLTAADLAAAGISNVNSEKFQLIRRGQEVAIHVSGQPGQPLGANDYIEFFGERNDGKLDTKHYKDPSFQIHTHYSLYTDTAAYFLTWGTTNGKRMQVKTSNPAGLTPEPRVYREALRLKLHQYIAGTGHQTQSKTSWGDRSEGFASTAFGARTDTVSGLNLLETSGRKPQLEILVVDSYYPAAQVAFHIMPPNSPTRVLTNSQTGPTGVLSFPAFHYRKVNFDIEFSDIQANGTVRFRTSRADSTAAVVNYLRHSYYRVIYPQQPDLQNNNQVIFTDSAKTGPSYFLFSNAPANAVAYDITDSYNVIRTTGVDVGGQKGFVIDPASFKRRIFVANEQNFISPASITRPNFTSLAGGTAANYIIVTHPILHQPVPGTPYNDPPADYAAYRSSPAGGGYSTFVADMDQLYDQFHYGEHSPYAIAQFMDWVRVNGQPEYLLLMGKGIEQSFHAGNYRKNPNAYPTKNLVPAIGDKPSDILITADWRNNNYVPRVATGRLAVNNSAEIVAYLDKVKGHTLLGIEEWRKNVLHLGGGTNAGEISLFRRYLENYENKIEGPLLGAKVETKIRPNSGQTTAFINVKNEVNTGLSLITFFGHSSSTTSDLDIGYVSDPIFGYNNQDKYPMILMNGCIAGNAFHPIGGNQKYSFGEDWIMTPKKGAILFLADVAMAIPSALNNYSNQFYTTAFTDSAFYGKTIGEIQRETIRRTINTSPNNFENLMVANQMLLQGDPAVRLFAPEKPDYLVKANGLRLQSIPAGTAVTASLEQFNLLIDVKNNGKAIEDSLVISVKRTLPNGDTIRYAGVKFPPVFNEATYPFPIDSRNVNGFGTNKFEVFLDYGNNIDELNENNNTAELNQYLTINGVVALLPKEFSIVSGPKVTLIGQPANLLAQPRDYYFEIDTVNTFASPFRKSGVVANAAGKISWPVTLLPNSAQNDSLVYYWRFRFNTFTASEDTVWAESSFRYIPNSPSGWSQSHHGQFAKDELKQLTIDSQSKRFEFSRFSKELELKTSGGGKVFNASQGIFQNGLSLTGTSCINGNNSIIVLTVFNNKTLDAVNNIPTTTPPSQSGKCGFNNWSYYFYLRNSSEVDNLVNFINTIPNGYYVALLSENTIPFSTFTTTQRDAFRLLGSQLITSLNTGDPFAIVAQKGATPAQAVLLKEMTYDPADTTAANMQDVEFKQIILGSGTQGTITSTKIGPATQWTTLHHTVEKSGWDTYKLDLFGYDTAGVRQLIEPNITSSAFSLANVDAKEYPYLQLEMVKTDTSARTAPQLKQWLVVYQGVPEGMMRPELVGLNKYDISKQVASGKVSMRFAFSNISGLPFADSLTVIRSVTGSVALQDTIKVKQLLAGDSVFFDYEFSTGGMKGNNMVRVEVNPRILPEEYYFNNFLEVPFAMPKSDLHPVLDVAFDGVHIMDGDIVSPSPRISINLKDEDKYDYIQDPNKLEVFLKRPGSLNYERIDLTDASLVTLPNFTDANRDKRDFTVVYHPKNLPDGIYSLRVQGSDNSDQNAGFQPYTINFEVINESSVTHFYPYPNPFTSNTRFVFTLTGNLENMPRNLKIQIMTLTGKVVREIQKEELGMIKVGNNISEPWDGTDEYGDKLANGVYLYRVVMEKSPLEEMKHRRTSGDKSFNKEYGKLYILR